MASEWREAKWGDEIALEYGKALRGHDQSSGVYRVFGSNGPIGRTDQPLAPGPGVILGRKGAYRGVEYSPYPFFVIDTAYYVVSKQDHDMRWLYYAIKHHKLGEIDDGSPIPSTTRAAVYPRELEVPPPAEQRVIAHILGALDDKIELNRQLSATLEAMAYALFKSWFVDFEPVRAKAEGRDPGLPPHLAALFPGRLVETEHREVPEGWEVKPLSEIAYFLNGLALQKYPASDPANSLPAIKIAELRNGVSAKSDRASRGVPNKYVVKDGDFLFSWSGSLLAKFWTEGEGALNQHLFKVTSDRYPAWFFAKWVHVHLGDFQRIAALKATTMGHIQRSHLQAAMTNCPPDDTLADLGSAVSPLVERTIQINLECRALAALRDTLLPKLISGELRVKDAETFLERVL